MNDDGYCVLLYKFIEKPVCITLPMLRIFSPKAQGHKVFQKTSKPCHVGIH